jgi:hypothetical protein
MEVRDAKRLRQLEDENRRLKQLVADQSLLPPPRVVHSIYRTTARPRFEEPDASIGHVRI